MNKELTKGAIAPWLLVVFIIVLLGGGGYLVWNYISAKACKSCVIQPTPTALTSANETLGWQTYTNDTYGFSFKYPKTWSIKKNTTLNANPIIAFIQYPASVSIEGYPANGQAIGDITVRTNKKATDLINEELTNLNNQSDSSRMTKDQTEKTINGAPVQILKISNTKPLEGLPYDEVMYYFEQNSTTIKLQVIAPTDVSTKLNKTAENIFETFQFTTSTADWQTYKNDGCGYSIQYPQSWIVSSKDYHRVLLLTKEDEKFLNVQDFRANIEIGCDNFQAKTLDEFVANLQDKKDSTFHGIKSFDGTMLGIPSGIIQIKAFSNNNHLYRVDYSASDVVTKILSTFQFTK